MTKAKPHESLGQLMNVAAKTVNKQTVIEIKCRMPFKAALFQKLGKMMDGSTIITFDPSQMDAFGDTVGGDGGEE